MTEKNSKLFRKAELTDVQVGELNTAYEQVKRAATLLKLLNAITGYIKLICDNNDIRQFVIEKVGLSLNDVSIESDNIKIYRRAIQKYYLVCGDIEGKKLSEEDIAFINGYKRLLSSNQPIERGQVEFNSEVIIDVQQDADRIVLFHEELAKHFKKKNNSKEKTIGDFKIIYDDKKLPIRIYYMDTEISMSPQQIITAEIIMAHKDAISVDKISERLNVIYRNTFFGYENIRSLVSKLNSVFNNVTNTSSNKYFSPVKSKTKHYKFTP
jgi:hypothetical protein